MDEIGMFTALRPDPPRDADAMRAAARGRLASVIEGPGAVRVRRLTPRRIALAGGIAAVAATAGIVMPGMLPGAVPDALVSRAWAVEPHGDGTVTISVSQLLSDPAGLQRALRADGIPAFVTAMPMLPGGPKGYYPPCHYSAADRAPTSVQQDVILTYKAALRPPAREEHPTGQGLAAKFPARWAQWTIRPSAMPPGSALLIATWTVPGSSDSLVMYPQVLRHDQVPRCIPDATPPGPAPGLQDRQQGGNEK